MNNFNESTFGDILRGTVYGDNRKEVEKVIKQTQGYIKTTKDGVLIYSNRLNAEDANQILNSKGISARYSGNKVYLEHSDKVKDTKELVESSCSPEEIVGELIEGVILSETPEFWWSNTFNKINRSLPEEETTEEGLRKSLELIGNGNIKSSQDRLIYEDKVFGYDLFVSGKLEPKGYKYSVVFRGTRGVWVAGGSGGNGGGEIRRHGTNIKTIYKVIEKYINEFKSNV